MNYPASRKSDDVDLYGATRVADPYRWLEDLDSPEVAAWVAAQNAVTFAHLDSAAAARSPEAAADPALGLSAHRAAGDRERPAVLRPQHRPAAPGADLPARRACSSRRRWCSIPTRCRPTDRSRWRSSRPRPTPACWPTRAPTAAPTGRPCASARSPPASDLPDSVSWVRFSDLSWTHDSNGFFYSRYPEPPKNKVLEAALSGQAVYYHRLGTPQADDLLIYQRQDQPAWIVNATVSDDGRYVFIRTYRGADNNNQLHYIDLGDAGAPNVTAAVQPDRRDARRRVPPIGNDRSRLYLRSDQDAPNRCGSSRSISSTAIRSRGRWWSPSSRTPSSTPRSSAAASSFTRSSTCKAASRCSRSTAMPTATSRCRASARCPACTAAPINPRSGSRSARRSSPATVYRYDLDAGRSMAFEPADSPIDPSQYETSAHVRDVEGRHAGAVLPDQQEGSAARRPQSDHAVRLRRLLNQRAARLSIGCAGVARAGRRVRVGQPARRRRVRRALAQGRVTSNTSRTCSTTSLPSPNTWSARTTPRPIVSARWAARTAACWSAR